jgi:hypothetical protein
VPTGVTGAQRSRWLAELSEALQEAQRLLWQIDAGGLRSVDALELSARLEAAHAQVRSLRLRNSQSAINSAPEWTNLPWDRPSEDCRA